MQSVALKTLVQHSRQLEYECIQLSQFMSVTPHKRLQLIVVCAGRYTRNARPIQPGEPGGRSQVFGSSPTYNC